MSQAVDELWSIALKTPHVDAQTLAHAVEAAVEIESEMDYRTRLLVRDSVAALKSYWGEEQFGEWLSHSLNRERIEQTCAVARAQAEADGDDRGFSSLEHCIMDATKPNDVLRFFRELAEHVRKPTRLVVGGSISLILRNLLARRTDDVDVVNEVPEELRGQHQLLEDMVKRHRLRLSHFQSHYLPDGWERRLQSGGSFDDLTVMLVDPYDIFVGKLFSVRTKDRDDLRALVDKLDREKLVNRVNSSTASLRKEERMLEAAKKNWYILFGEQLPS